MKLKATNISNLIHLIVLAKAMLAHTHEIPYYKVNNKI